ncbi:MAG: substrate-binding domain-containing protein [Cyanobacterium sp. T60_A2020_053]|nr:substrate-binding domain-containing protein [Cyanobacterium sp. T60_A2020_053]
MLLTISMIITYAPLPFQKTTLHVVIGSELQEPLKEIERIFEENYPNIEVNLKVQGSQDIVNNIINKKNDFPVTIVIPASDELISELDTRLRALGKEKPFNNNPQPIAETLLVAMAWQERGKQLFPNNKFNWDQLENALISKNWGDIKRVMNN